MADQTNIQSAASKSIRPFRSSEEYLYAMKEDLAEWLNALYELDITADTFMEGLETGCALCRHANNVNRAARDFQAQHPEAARVVRTRMPSRDVVFQSRNVIPGSFLARDNVSNFISWCRQELGIQDVLMFETNDLVERCNEKNFVLCLLEVARRGAKFGMLAPMLIQLEEEIDEEIRDQESLGDSLTESLVEPVGPPNNLERKKGVRDADSDLAVSWQEQKRVLCDMRNLDELVREILGQCSCPSQFPMTKVSEGKYKVGDSSALIFIRVLRTHVMVRVGGGWDTLEHYLDKHDPCRCNAFAHRYQQAKASGQAPHSKSSSAHSSRSTSPGPHWRSDAIAPYKTAERRSLEPSAVPNSSSRPGRAHHGSLPGDGELNSGRAATTLLPRPPRDRSEPRHFNPLRNKDSLLPLTRRLSGDSDSSTASSKGGGGTGGGAGGGRLSLGSRRLNGEEVVLLVNRKEGKHVIERPDGSAQMPSLRLPQSRARSASRERPAHPPSCPGALKPSPPQGPVESHRPAHSERGRSLGLDGQRRLQGPRSLSQGKTPLRGRASEASPVSPRHRDSHPSTMDRREEPRSKQAPPPGSPRLSGGISRRQMPSSASNSPIKSGSSSSPTKKGVVTPRPPAPRSPSVGSRRLLPPVSQAGRRSPHSSPRSSHHHHHPPRSPRTIHSPRSAGKQQRGLGQPQQQALDQQEETGFGLGYQTLPSLDAQREMDLYRSFEAEFLANTQQQPQSTQSRSGSTKEMSGLQPPVSQQNVGALGMLSSGDSNITDSAYSSSNSSSSSVNVGGRMGVLPDLRESRRTNGRNCALEDPPTLLHSQTRAGLPNGGLRERERWTSPSGALRKLPAISSSMEEGEPVRESNPELPCNFLPSTHVSRQLNGRCGGLQPTNMDTHTDYQNWAGLEGDVPLDEQQPDLPHDYEDANANADLPLPETFPSPLPPPPDDCSCNDSSSESSSMCLSLSETLSAGSSTPPPPLANGDTNGTVVLRAKKGQKKSERVPSIYKLKLRPRIRPRTDNRPENSPSRIPTPVSYRDLHRQQQSPANLSPLQTPPLSPRPHGHPPSHKALHQAFAGLIHPQQRSSPMGSRERSFSSEASLDAEPWM